MKPGRNDPCHCGSGDKYKKCHLIADEEAASKAAAEAAATAAATLAAEAAERGEAEPTKASGKAESAALWKPAPDRPRRAPPGGLKTTKARRRSV